MFSKFDSVTLHNVGEAVPVSNNAFRLQRVPESVRVRLEAPARERFLNPAGAEIRFVPTKRSVRVTLSTVDGTGSARIFYGPFDARVGSIPVGREPVTISAELPEASIPRIDAIPEAERAKLHFDPAVVRIQLTRDCFVLHGIEGECRPPTSSELPRLTMLAYGTSLSHGYLASGAHLSYPAQVAWRLKCDLVNLAVGGGCRCEDAIIEHIAGRNDWDFAVFEPSANLLGSGASGEEFRRRFGALLKSVSSAHPRKPIWCISNLPYYGDWTPGSFTQLSSTSFEYRTILEEIVSGCGSHEIRFIPGSELLTDYTGFAVDLIHHSDLGMIHLAEELASRMRAEVTRLKNSLE